MNRQWPITKQYCSSSMFSMVLQGQDFQNQAYTRNVCWTYVIHLFMEYEISCACYVCGLNSFPGYILICKYYDFS